MEILRRNDSVVKRAGCSYRRPKFSSQHQVRVTGRSMGDLKAATLEGLYPEWMTAPAWLHVSSPSRYSSPS